jgi:biopolymer transport protein ExbD
MKPLRRRSEREPTIALINIVFLMLIFFLVAGTLARPLDPDLQLVRTRDLERTTPADALVFHADGNMEWQGEPVADVAALVARLPDDSKQRLRVVPDRELPASRLVEIGRALRAAGAERVVIVTERALP